MQDQGCATLYSCLLHPGTDWISCLCAVYLCVTTNCYSQLINDPYWKEGCTREEYESAVQKGGKHNLDYVIVLRCDPNGLQTCGAGFSVVQPISKCEELLCSYGVDYWFPPDQASRVMHLENEVVAEPAANPLPSTLPATASSIGDVNDALAIVENENDEQVSAPSEQPQDRPCALTCIPCVSLRAQVASRVNAEGAPEDDHTISEADVSETRACLPAHSASCGLTPFGVPPCVTVGRGRRRRPIRRQFDAAGLCPQRLLRPRSLTCVPYASLACAAQRSEPH